MFYPLLPLLIRISTTPHLLSIQLKELIKWKNYYILTVFTVVAMLSERTETEVATARIGNARASVLARIVVAHGDLAGRPDVSRGAFALPITNVFLRLLLAHH